MNGEREEPHWQMRMRWKDGLHGEGPVKILRDRNAAYRDRGT